MSFLKGGKFKPMNSVKTEETEKKEEVKKINPLGANKTTSPFGKKKLGSLNKKKEEPEKIDLEEKKEDVKEETPTTGVKKKLSMKLGAKTAEPQKEEPVEEEVVKEEEKKEEVKETVKEDSKETVVEEAKNPKEVEEKKEEKEETKKTQTTSKKKTTNKAKTTKASKAKEEEVSIEIPEVDESRRVSLKDMEAIMRPIVAPTTDEWEQEKKDVREALKKIKVEQDMTMVQVKSAFSELDDLRFQIGSRFHEIETEFDGTKSNYESVKTLAIANSKGTNSELRKAAGILACKNYTTPEGDVIDLNIYMLFIEEKYKFYQKIINDIDFKRYSLVNYNNALKIESKGL